MSAPTHPLPRDGERNEPRGAGKTIQLGLGLSILGSTLAAFGPLLPWWKITTRTLGIELHAVTGTEVWLGVVAFIAGVTALGTCTYLYARTARKGSHGLVVLGAGAIAFVCAVIGAARGAWILGTTFQVSSRIGILISLVGGLITTVGGYLQTREGSER